MKHLLFHSRLRGWIYFLIVVIFIYFVFSGSIFVDQANGRVTEIKRASELSSMASLTLDNGRVVLLPDIIVRWVTKGDHVEKERYSYCYSIHFAQWINGSYDMYYDITPDVDDMPYASIACLFAALVFCELGVRKLSGAV